MRQRGPEGPERPRDQSRPPNDDRQPFWMVTKGQRALYVGLFQLFFAIGLGFVLWREIFENTADSPADTAAALILATGPAGAGAAALTVLTMILVRYTRGW